jgi:D-alanyl-D-alanine carboxypeptidase/D-alanyl-D-alanine-endopeptidase (penicillin-binding protein 4)
VAAGVFLALELTGEDRGTALAEQVPDAVLPELSDPAPVLTEVSADAPVPDPDVLAAVLTPLLSAPALGSGQSAQVVDVATGEVLFDEDAEDPSTPASTAKLLTGVAALTTLGPTDTLTTTVVAGSSPGEVVLVGGGDPTLSTTTPATDYPGAATVAELAGEVQQALAGQPVTRVVVDNSLFTGPQTAPGWGPGDAPSTYAAPVTAAAVDGARVEPGENQRSGSPSTDAGRALAAALGAPQAAVSLGKAPAGARTLGSVESAPIVRLVEQALTASDNLLAESLGRHVAIARGLPASFDGAADGISATLADAGLDTTGLVLFDASGLSQDDRLPASLLVDVVRGAADGSIADADGLLTGLPVAGFDGTLAERAVEQGDAAPGSVRAKTGTLLGVNALAGTVLTVDGRLLAFAVVADGATGSVATSEAALDVVADSLAGCGCR